MEIPLVPKANGVIFSISLRNNGDIFCTINPDCKRWMYDVKCLANEGCKVPIVSDRNVRYQKLQTTGMYFAVYSKYYLL